MPSAGARLRPSEHPQHEKGWMLGAPTVPQMSEGISAGGSRAAAIPGEGWTTMQGTDRARAGH